MLILVKVSISTKELQTLTNNFNLKNYFYTINKNPVIQLRL
jgi:hypothetical protein